MSGRGQLNMAMETTAPELPVEYVLMLGERVERTCTETGPTKPVRLHVTGLRKRQHRSCWRIVSDISKRSKRGREARDCHGTNRKRAAGERGQQPQKIRRRRRRRRRRRENSRERRETCVSWGRIEWKKWPNHRMLFTWRWSKGWETGKSRGWGEGGARLKKWEEKEEMPLCCNSGNGGRINHPSLHLPPPPFPSHLSSLSPLSSCSAAFMRRDMLLHALTNQLLVSKRKYLYFIVFDSLSASVLTSTSNLTCWLVIWYRGCDRAVWTPQTGKQLKRPSRFTRSNPVSSISGADRRHDSTVRTNYKRQSLRVRQSEFINSSLTNHRAPSLYIYIYIS